MAPGRAIGPGRVSAAAWLRDDQTATRRMCAGVYVDHGYRDELLRGVYNEVSRRVAPSYGCDVVAVLQHAWRAWWISLAERVTLVVFVAVALIRVPLDTVIVVSVLAVWALAGGVRAWAAEAVRYASGRKTELDARQLRARGRLLGSGLAAAAGAAVAAMVAGAAGRAGGGWAARTGVVGAGVILAGCAAIVAAAVGARMVCLARLRRGPLRGAGLRRRLAVIDAQQEHPVTVHSGFRPFIGSGLNVQSWSFAQRLVRRKVLGTEPDQEFDVLPFTTADLVGRLKQTMTGIRDFGSRGRT